MGYVSQFLRCVPRVPARLDEPTAAFDARNREVVVAPAAGAAA